MPISARMSVMEMSHRGKEFIEIQGQAEADLRALMGIPANYKVLFLQGGASLQFSMVPLNLLPAGGKADYVLTGAWAKKAASEAKRYGTVNVAATSAETNFNRIPTQAELKLDPGAAYVHITGNNTIFGTEYHYTPDTGAVPLVNDASSNILSRPVDVSRYGLIYAGAQKNIGPAGLTLVIVRDDLIGRCREGAPTMLDYAIHAENDSAYNTPPTFAIYVAGLVFKHLLNLGGLPAVEKANVEKADLLYGLLDRSAFYNCPTEPASRSRMHIPFTLTNAELDAAFLAEAKKAGLVQLKGHRSVGGMRASIYNAMPLAGVKALVDFMVDFERRNA
jgi:phosphoserine aminotransferase